MIWRDFVCNWCGKGDKEFVLDFWINIFGVISFFIVFVWLFMLIGIIYGFYDEICIKNVKMWDSC